MNERLAICKHCKLRKIDSKLGEMCDSNKWLNPKTDELSDIKKEGFYNGCGCIIRMKVQDPYNTCPLRKW